MKKIRIVVIVITLIFVIIYIKNTWKILFNIKNVNGNIHCSESIEDIRNILNSKRDKIIIVDSGHGGNDPGKV